MLKAKTMETYCLTLNDAMNKCTLDSAADVPSKNNRHILSTIK